MQPPNLLLVIVDYRVPQLVLACLASLEPAMAAFPNLRITVVENSGAEVAARLRPELERWRQWVRLVVPERNLGFAAGNNVAIREALAGAEPPDYILLLNPDTVVRAGAIEALVRFLQQHPEAGIAGSRLEGPDGIMQASPFRFPSLASEIDRGFQFGVVSALLRPWALVMPKPPNAARVDWVAGAAMLVRRQVFQSAGLLDEGYFTYFEDVDFCWQARRAGWTTWYVPESRIVHLEGQSSGVTASQRDLPDYWFAARRRFFRKNYGARWAALIDWALRGSIWLGRWRCRLQGKPAPRVAWKEGP